MPQGKKIPIEIIEQVRKLLVENEDLTGKEIQSRIEKENPKNHCSVRTCQKIIKQELPKVKLIKSSIPENTWSLGSLVNTGDITPESIPHILGIQEWASNEQERFTKKPFPPISVRQAKWMSRILSIHVMLAAFSAKKPQESPLYWLRIWFLQKKIEDKSKDKAMYWLWTWSKVYAISERLYELSGKREKGEGFNTSELDAALWRGDIVEVWGDTYVLTPRDKDKIGVMVTADKNLIEESMKAGEADEQG